MMPIRPDPEQSRADNGPSVVIEPGKYRGFIDKNLMDHARKASAGGALLEAAGERFNSFNKRFSIILNGSDCLATQTLIWPEKIIEHKQR